MKSVRLALFLCALISPLPAQWLNYPTPGIPRTADGKPNLTAPAPRTTGGKPDLSGLWHRPSERYYNNIAADLKPGNVQPWADALYQKRKVEFGKDSMDTLCLPFGPGYSTTPFVDSKIIQTPALIAILNEDLTYRQIYLDGRELEKDPNPAWMGYSVGRWDGDTLVVESNGFNDRTWLDLDGHPHTEELRMTERYHRRDFGHMDLRITLDDPKAYPKPWTIEIPMELFPDTEILEYVCKENETSRQHMNSSGPAPREISVAPATGARYAGVYDYRNASGIMHTVEITHSDGALYWAEDGGGKQRMMAFSGNEFSLSGSSVQFVADSKDEVTHFLYKWVEAEMRGEKR